MHLPKGTGVDVKQHIGLDGQYSQVSSSKSNLSGTTEPTVFPLFDFSLSQNQIQQPHKISTLIVDLKSHIKDTFFLGLHLPASPVSFLYSRYKV